MVGRLICALLLVGILAGCSGSIYRQRPVRGSEPVAITVDARQRLLLSQAAPGDANDPVFRRFCAEPSPDVFTVLGVAASGGGNLGLGADRSVSAALQGAFSSSESGATIARTQTLNMLREMMFRTCERYLSGAISPDEFAIIAARDQRIMVSILAIEQLTGVVTPRSVALSATGESQTGFDPTEAMRLLVAAQEDLDTAQADVTAKTGQLAAADVPAGNCATLRAKKAAGETLAAPDAQKLQTCDTAARALAESQARLDVAQARYDTLAAASRSGLGTSRARTGGTVTFRDEEQRAEAVRVVAATVGAIVEENFNQDETQLFCIRVLNPLLPYPPRPELEAECRTYLIARVMAESNELLSRLGMTREQLEANLVVGRRNFDRQVIRAEVLHRCATDSVRGPQLAAALGQIMSAEQATAAFAAFRQGADEARGQLRRMGEVMEDHVAGAANTICELRE